MSQRTLVSDGMQVIEDDLLNVLIHILLFPNDRPPLSFDSGGFKLRILQDVRKDIDGGLGILAEALCVVDRLLSRRPSVQVHPHVLDFEFEVVLAAFLRSLEGEMLEEVSCAARIGCVCSRTGVDPAR